MLCWSLQRSCTIEPVTAALGTSQDGVCGGTRGQHKSSVKAASAGRNASDSPSGAFVPIRVLPRTLRVTLVSPKVTVSNGALISQRYSPASSWVTLLKVTVAPSMLARPSKEPEGHVRRSGGLPQLQLILLLNVIIHNLDPFLSCFGL